MSRPQGQLDLYPVIARQHLSTSHMMGVDFVPVRHGSPPDDGGAPPTASTQELPPTCAAPGDKSRLLKELQARHDQVCPHCTSATYHTRTVFGEGNPDARLMFIGEAPGEEEDRTGRPFVGRAGQKLDEIIRAMGMQREDVYIANVLKSRPPENRTPLQHEVEACGAFLREQVRIIEPVVIVALGGPAAKMLLQTETGITRLRGMWGTYAVDDLLIPVMPTFHPAYLLRNYTVDTRQKMWSDMQAVMKRLRDADVSSAS